MLTTAPHLHVRRPSPTTAKFTVSTCPPSTLSLRILLAVVFLLRILLCLFVLLLLHSAWMLSPYNRHAEATNIATATPTATSVLAIVSSNEHIRLLHESSISSSSSSIVIIGGGDADDGAPDHAEANRPPSTWLTTDWARYALGAAHQSPPGRAARDLAASLPWYLVLPLCAAALYLTTLRIHTTESLLVLRGLGVQTSSTGGSYLAGWRAGTRFIPTEKIRDVLINEAFRGFAVRYYLVVVVDGEEDVVVVFPRLLPRRRVVEAVWRGVRGCLWEPDGSVPVGKRFDEKGVCG